MTLGLGVLGCGDVALNMYLPALRGTSDLAVVAAVCDTDKRHADAAIRACADWSRGAVAYTERRAFLAHPGLDAVIQLLPAPLHGEANAEILRNGLHVLSEKPLASSVSDADQLIELAAGKHLLCAPGVMVMPTIRFADQILRSGRLGTPTVALAAWGTLGGAGARRHTGDTSVYYSEAVGPVRDLGVYLVHALTGLLGSVRRVHAMGATRMPERTSVAPGSRGQRIRVSAHDVVLAQLEFSDGTLAQLFSSYASPALSAPHLEVALTDGTITIGNVVRGDTIDVYTVDSSRAALDGWMRAVAAPESSRGLNVVGLGAQHFVRVLAGIEEPVLTARHARHALDVMETIVRSAREHVALETTTELAIAPPAELAEAAVGR